MSTLNAWHPVILVALVAMIAVWVTAFARMPIRALMLAGVLVAGFFVLLPSGRTLWDTMSQQRTAINAVSCLGASVAQTGFWTGRTAPESLAACQHTDSPPARPAPRQA